VSSETPPRQTASEVPARVVQVTDEHAEALAEFYTAAWGQKVSADGVRRTRATTAAANFVSPGETPPTFLFLTGNRAVGYLGTIPVRFAVPGSPDQPAHWLKGLWVLPEQQNGPVGFLVLREATRHVGMAMAMVVELAARRLFQAHGFTDLGPLPNDLKLLASGRILRRLDLAAVGLGRFPGWVRRSARVVQWPPLAVLGGGITDGAIRLWSGIRGRGTRVDVGPPELPARSELDRLFERLRPGFGASVVRDGAYLEYRYGGRRAREYLVVPLRVKNDLQALAVVRRPSGTGDPRLRGIRVAVLSELLYPVSDRGMGCALLAAAEHGAQELGADALLVSATHAAVRPLLRRRAYLPLPRNVHFMVRMPAGGPALPRALGSFWLTRGDSEADEAF
jgi:hypothetical protein